MNILFAIFAVFLISTVHAIDECDNMAKDLFELANKLIRLFTVSTTEYKVYRETVKLFIVPGDFPKNFVNSLKLPTELSTCKKLLDVLANKPRTYEPYDVDIITIKYQQINIENILFNNYHIDAEDVCEVLPKAIKKFYNKVKNLVNSGSPIVTLDDFCKMNTSICSVTDAASIKLVAYLSNGYNPIFQEFVPIVQTQEFLRRFSRSLLVRFGGHPLNVMYENCVLQLMALAVNQILNS